MSLRGGCFKEEEFLCPGPTIDQLDPDLAVEVFIIDAGDAGLELAESDATEE